MTKIEIYPDFTYFDLDGEELYLDDEGDLIRYEGENFEKMVIVNKGWS